MDWLSDLFLGWGASGPLLRVGQSPLLCGSHIQCSDLELGPRQTELKDRAVGLQHQSLSPSPLAQQSTNPTWAELALELTCQSLPLWTSDPKPPQNVGLRLGCP